MADGYEYDVFISYRRLPMSIEWMQKIFMPVFKHYLVLNIPDAKIFIDYDIEAGCSWPAKLANGLSRSKVLVGLWNKPYFSSKWCKTELSLMYARERDIGFGTRENPQRLIIPASVHDGDDFPIAAKEIQQRQLQDYCVTWLANGSQKKEDLEVNISSWVNDVVRAINKVPGHNPAWAGIAYDSFMDTFASSNCEQNTLPNVGN